MPAHVFISYSSADKSLCNRIVEALMSNGITAWRDSDFIRPGGEFWDEIEHAIKNSGCVLLILSAASALSENVKREIEYALQRQIPIIPLHYNLTGADVSSWWNDHLGHLQVIRLQQNFVRAIRDQVISTVREHIHRVCRTLAILNMKGGVGKTMMAAQLGPRIHHLLDRNVLLIDMDPQQNLTELFVKPADLAELHKVHRSIIGLFEPHKINRELPEAHDLECNCIAGFDHEADYQDLCFQTSFATGIKRLDILPSQYQAVKYIRLQAGEREIAIRNFKRALSALRQRYDYIVIDCNPAASLLSEAALNGVDHLLCPVRPDGAAPRGLQFLWESMTRLYDLETMPEMHIAFNFVNEQIPSETKLMGSLRQGAESLPYYCKRFVGKYLEAGVHESRGLRSTHGGGRSFLARLRPGYQAYKDLDRLACELSDRIEKGTGDAQEGDRVA